MIALYINLMLTISLSKKRLINFVMIKILDLSEISIVYQMKFY